MPKNILIYKTLRMSARQCAISFFKSQINLQMCICGSRPHSTINGYCKTPHKCLCIEMSLLVFVVL